MSATVYKSTEREKTRFSLNNGPKYLWNNYNFYCFPKRWQNSHNTRHTPKRSVSGFTAHDKSIWDDIIWPPMF